MRRATILCYHAVGDCERADDPYDLYLSTQAFADQMSFLHAKRTVVTLDEALSSDVRSSRPLVAITFDDGYRSVLRNALPILASYSYPSTVFVPTAYLGKTNSWSPSPRGDFDVMDSMELKKVANTGMAVESHGHAHIDFSVCDREEAATDLAMSVEILERMVGHRPDLFAYPYGRTSSSSEACVRAAGFRAAFTLDEKSRGRFGMDRVSVLHLDGPKTFAAKTSGYWTSLRHSRAGAVASGTLRRMARKPRS